MDATTVVGIPPWVIQGGAVTVILFIFVYMLLKQIPAMQADHKATIEKLVTGHEEAMSHARQDFRQSLENQGALFERRIEKLQDQHDAHITRITEGLDSLTKQVHDIINGTSE